MTKAAVIGARGQIGRLLVEELRRRGWAVVAIERSSGGAAGGYAAGVERCPVDAGDVEALTRALAGCDVAYSVLGLPYRADVWEAQWPPLMAGVAEAARRAGSRLVYLDNLYGYGRVEGPITEETPLRPVSRMGRARAVTAEQLLQGETPVVIGRAADFVGPGAVASSAGAQVFGPVVRGTGPVRRVPWLGDPRRLHSWAGTGTVAAALATLGEDPDGPRGVWLLPVYRPVTGHDFCEALGRVAGCTVTPRSVPTWAVRLGGVVRPDLRAVAQGMYQLTSDQVVDDRQWRQRFPVDELDFEDLLAEALRWFTDRRRAVPA